MADVTSTLNSWSSTSSSNLPANSAAVGPNTLADNQRVIQAVVRAAVAGDGTIASATTTDLSTVNDGDITVTGTTTITGLGTLTAGIKKVLTFSGVLTLTHNATSLILPGAANITTAAGDVAVMRSLGSGNWKCIAFQPAAGNAKSGANADITSMTALTAPTVAANPVRAADLQVQLATAFTTGGTSTAFTLTPTPASAANTTNQRYRIKFNAAAGATPTLAVSGLTALNLKYRDSTGGKQAITATQVPINWISDVENDGTDWVVLDVPSSGAAASETVAGLLEIATAAEAQAFTANKAIDGAKLAAALQGANQSLATSGYQKLPGGLIMQWKYGAAAAQGTSQTITFPITFPTGILHISVSPTQASVSGNNTGIQTRAQSFTTSSVVADLVNTLASINSNTIIPVVFAIGY